ncbi:MAG TPA: RNA-guided endonuclease TnpB family protein [Ktedonobacteraceae bacterium]|nr:RNA-guided endonuclease TnpB family protein [Ktedonobacteraceae bacterium]
MKVIRGYKTELDLTNAQKTACLKHAGAARWAYNWGLRRYQEEYAAGRKTPSAISLHKELNALKQTEIPWMYDVSKCCGQEALRDLEQAFKHFFRKCQLKKMGQWKGKLGYPRFKSKKKGIGSFRLTGSIHVGEKTIQLPRLGKLRLKEKGKKKYIPTSGVKILSATVSEQAGRWFVSVQMEEEVADALQASGQAIGVDLGIKTLATCSDGRTIENPKALRKNLKKLKRLSRRHSRKQERGKNRKKAAHKLARLHARIAHIRSDALHKATSSLVAKTKPCDERPAVIVIEDLNVSGMLKNRKLSRAIADVGFAELRRQFEYKAGLAGSTSKVVSCWYPSSKTCSNCEWVDEDQTLADRVFLCQECGMVLDRDLNAALNLAASA